MSVVPEDLAAGGAFLRLGVDEPEDVPTVVARLWTRFPLLGFRLEEVLPASEDVSSSAVLFSCPREVLILGFLCWWLFLSSLEGILGFDFEAALLDGACSVSMDLGLDSWSSLDIEAVVLPVLWPPALGVLDLE